MGIGFTILYIISFLVWVGAVFWLPRTKEKENGLIWLIVTLVLYECWAAFISGLMSLAHIPVDLLSVSIANIIVAGAIVVLYRKLDRSSSNRNSAIESENSPFGVESISSGSRWALRQRYSICLIDVAFTVCLVAFCIYVWHVRFNQEAAIIYATIDPADRFSRAVGILTERTVIGPYPNMYFGHITNALFMGAAEPAFSGVFMVRAFIIKDIINMWLAGMLFYCALRQFSDKTSAKIVFFILGFVYTLGFPWNNQLWGFGYLGMAVTLIILVQIGVKFLKDGRQAPVIGLIIIAAGCFGVGITYTMFAPPVFIAAFLAILVWKKQSIARIAMTEIAVFAVPTILVLAFTVLIGSGESGSDLGSQFMLEGAIYRNLFGDFLIWLPLALFAVVLAVSKKKWDFSCIFAIAFFVFQAYFLYRMLDGTVSTYYYYKLNFVTWLIVLLLAGIASSELMQNSGRKAIAAIGCWLLVFFAVGVFTVRGYDASLSDKGEHVNPIYAASGLFGLYANNNSYFEYPENNIVYFRWDFLELCEAARIENLSLQRERPPGDFYGNRIEIITNDFHNAYWADALVGEHIKHKPAYIDFMPSEEVAIWIVLRNSSLYQDNADVLDQFPRIFENELGFVIVR